MIRDLLMAENTCVKFVAAFKPDGHHIAIRVVMHALSALINAATEHCRFVFHPATSNWLIILNAS